MKKILFIITMLVTTSLFSQSITNDYLSQIRAAGKDMSIGQDYLIASSALGVASAGLLIGSAYVHDTENAESPHDFMVYSGIVLGGASVAFYIAHLVRMKRGTNKLRNLSTKDISYINYYQGPSGIGLSFNIDR